MKIPNAAETVVDIAATWRLVHLLQQDELPPLPVLRDKLIDKAGDRAWGDLVTCPFCASFWVAIGVLVARRLFPRAWPLLARVLAASLVTGIGETHL